LTTLFGNTEKDGSYISVLLHFDTRDLTFTEGADGVRTAMVDIAMVTFDSNGDPSPAVNRTWRLRVRPANYDAVLKSGMVYSAFVPMKKAGAYQLRIALRDATSQKLGSAMQFIEVPDVKGGRLALSGIVLTTDPPSADDPNGSPAVRIFKQGSTLAYAYEVLNSRSGGDHKGPLQSQMRIYRDGEIVHEGMPAELMAVDARDPTHLATGARLRLGRILPGGEYIMQIVVFDGSRKDNARLATQSIDFEVRP
jgi:hypothetical protein